MNFKTTLAIGAIITLPFSAFAAGENNVGCGLGTHVFEGQSGVGPQVMAATTNGTSGNQTFGITFGTLGCTSDGMVPKVKKTALFIDGNMERLARDMSRGDGESLNSLSSLIGVQEDQKAQFNALVKSNYTAIYKEDTAVSSTEVIAALRTVLASDSQLASYASSI